MKITVAIIVLVLLAACGNSDSERLIGTWKPYMDSVDGEVMSSLDPHIQRQAINREWQRSKKRGHQVSRKSIEEELNTHAELLRSMSMRFDKGGKTVMETTMPPKISISGTWKLDEAKHELIVVYNKLPGMRSKTSTIVYQYTFLDDELYLQLANSETAFRKAKN